MTIRFRLSLLFLLLAPQAFSQAHWEQIPTLVSRTNHAMAYDPVRDRVVLFGGQYTVSRPLADTWEWDGTRWRYRRTTRSPSPRFSHRMAFDHATNKVLLFGGTDGTKNFQDTWEWDGADWTQLAPKTAPSARCEYSLASDPVRKRVVLFGGYPYGQYLRATQETWEWDGNNWIQRQPKTSPPTRAWHASGYCAKTGRVIMGGDALSGHLGTWSWDGSNWTQQTGALPFPQSAAVTMTGTPNGTVIAVGNSPATPGNAYSTREWNGSQWKTLQAGIDRNRVTPVVTRDRTHVLLHGGTQVGESPNYEDTLVLQQGRWQVAHRTPRLRNETTAVHMGSRDEFVLLESNPSHPTITTWTLRDGALTAHHTPLAPVPMLRGTFGVVYHRGLDRVWLYGGFAGSKPLYDVWLWDGSTWTVQRASSGPRPGQVAYDSLRQKVVLLEASGATWEWHANSGWKQLTTTGPGSRNDYALAYDPARRRTVLFGGMSVTGYFDETWEWDGARWRMITTRPRPPARMYGRLTYVPAYGGLVLIGGIDRKSQCLTDTWLWNGKAWTQLQLANRYPCLPWDLMRSTAYDGGRQSILAVYHGNPPIGWLWRYGFDHLTTTRRYVASGGSFSLVADFPAEPFDLLWIAMSLSTRPAIPVRPVLGVGTELLPLAPDTLFWATASVPLLRMLDGKGRANMPLSLPGGVNLLGVRLHLAGLTFDKQLALAAISNAATVEVVR